MYRRTRLIVAMSVIATYIALFYASCAGESKANEPAKSVPLKEYPVRKLTYQSTVTHKSYPATVEGIQTVELRPRVSGYLQEIYVDEGARVSKGQPMFKINADEFNQQVNAAKANVAVAKAKVNTTKMEVEKQRPLVEKGIVSEYILTAAQYAQESAEAALQQAEADLQNALTNLSYTTVKSPANGIIGTIPYRIGSLVGSSNTEPLTFISDISQVRVYFAVNEKDFLTLSRNLSTGTKSGKDKKQQEVQLIMVDGSPYDQPGVIDAMSGLINSATGSATLRATFNNPNGLLRSGSSATIKIPTPKDSVLVIPQGATYELQNKRFIYVVEEGDTVKPRAIEVVPDDAGKDFIVKHGLQPDEIIVLDGINSLQAGAKIKPVQE